MGFRAIPCTVGCDRCFGSTPAPKSIFNCGLGSAPLAATVIAGMSEAERHAYRVEQASTVKMPYLVFAGVLIVLVLDPEPRTAHVFSADDPPRTLTADEELTLPGLLDGFRVPVSRFFD